MPADDVIHGAVKNALTKDGWTITADPYVLEYEEIRLFADLRAERPIAAERAEQRIVIEIKSFLGPSPMRELELALGQYDIYRGLLEVIAPECRLYLAVGKEIHEKVFKGKGVQMIMNRYQVSLIVVDLTAEEIVQWIN